MLCSDLFKFSSLTQQTVYFVYTIRLSELGLDPRKQSQDLSEAQHVVTQERMKNEQLRSDIRQFHEEASKNGARLDEAAMQLHMAKKRQVNAERRMAVSKKRLQRLGSTKSRDKKGTSGNFNTQMPDYSIYPEASTGGIVERAAFKDTAAIISAMKSASSRTAIQKELQKIEDEFQKRSVRNRYEHG